MPADKVSCAGKRVGIGLWCKTSLCFLVTHEMLVSCFVLFRLHVVPRFDVEYFKQALTVMAVVWSRP
jgi:hypothetical protein